ncbi:MAG: DHH family phosphoesterase [Candidatus Peribacteraceae bacterium]|nr:DHH family phosphoesterase [Candidatus Peribacteraceae bacterium]MBP9850558.1 DHH family phosphoesterase [Candidatus Peribacteraceae bacterium]
MIEQVLLDRALDIIKKAKRLRCVCHRNPDGDAIGAITAMAQLLEANLPDAMVELYCVDPAPPTFGFLPLVHRIKQDLKPDVGDVFIFLDSAEPKLTEYHETLPQIFGGEWPSVCIDHHPTNSRYATVNIIVPEASSTCEILVDFADGVGWTMNPDIATSLLTGVYTDTGGLVHSNTTARVYRTVARLLRAGARQQAIVQKVFRSAKISTLRLWGRVLEKISITPEGGAISALTEGDFRATGADYSELTGAIDYVNAVPGMRFSLILAERAGKVKGSLRTLRDDVDVSKMAGAFQGGGHKKAAGFAVEGKLVPEMRWKVQQ